MDGICEGIAAATETIERLRFMGEATEDEPEPIADQTTESEATDGD